MEAAETEVARAHAQFAFADAKMRIRYADAI
jgi:hypothetical protein